MLESVFRNFREHFRQDLAQVANEIRAAWSAEAGQQLYRDLRQATGEIKEEVRREKFADALKQISEDLKAEALSVKQNLAKVELPETAKQLDTSSILEVVTTAKHDIEELKEQVTGSIRSFDLPGLLQEIQELRQCTSQVHQEQIQCMSQVQVDLSTALSVMGNIKAAVDSSPVVQEIQAPGQRKPLAELDLSPVLGEIRELSLALQQVKASAQQEATIVASPATLHDLSTDFNVQPNLAPLMQEIKELRQQRLEADLPAALEAIRQASAQLDPSLLLQEVRELRVHCPQQDLSELKQQVLQARADVSVLLQTVNDIRATLGLSPVLQEIRELRQQQLLGDLRTLRQQRREVDAAGSSAVLAHPTPHNVVASSR